VKASKAGEGAWCRGDRGKGGEKGWEVRKCRGERGHDRRIGGNEGSWWEKRKAKGVGEIRDERGTEGMEEGARMRGGGN